MAADVYVKRNDTWPAVTTTLEKLEGSTWSAINLSTALKVTFIMRSLDGKAVAEGTCSIVNAAKGELSYLWGLTDLKTAGDYHVEFEIEWSSTHIQTVPNQGYRELTVEADLGGH